MYDRTHPPTHSLSHATTFLIWQLPNMATRPSQTAMLQAELARLACVKDASAHAEPATPGLEEVRSHLPNMATS